MGEHGSEQDGCYRPDGLRSHTDSVGGDSHAALTTRDCENADLVATGLTNREIAQQLAVWMRTFESHVGHIKRKLGLVRGAESSPGSSDASPTTACRGDSGVGHVAAEEANLRAASPANTTVIPKAQASATHKSDPGGRPL